MELNECFKRFDDYLKACGCAKATIESYGRTLGKFEKYLQLSDRSSQAEAIRRDDLTGFLGACEDAGEKRSSVIFRLTVLKKFFGWLKGERLIAEDPAAAIPMPREAKRIPRYLSPQQLESLLNQPDTGTPCGLRDRALMDVVVTLVIRGGICGEISSELPENDAEGGLGWWRQSWAGR